MNRLRVYGISLLLLITSTATSFLIIILRSKFNYIGYLDPIYHLWLFGPTIAALIFLAITKENIAHTVGLNKVRNISTVVVLFILLFLAATLSRLIQFSLGFIRLENNDTFFHLFGIQFTPVWGSLIWLFLLLIHAGFAEEFAWRGFLYSRVKHLPWVEQVLLINTIWAIWHFPFMRFSQVQQYLLFWVQCLEIGTVLVYARFKTGSSISAMILHPWTVFSLSVLSLPYCSVVNSDWAGWPNYTIAILFLPIAVYYFIKGQRETKAASAA